MFFHKLHLPDTDTIRRTEPTAATLAEMQTTLVEIFKKVLERANFQPLSRTDLTLAFEKESLIPLKTQVDFDDFEEMIFYYRGDIFKKTTFKKLYFIPVLTATLALLVTLDGLLTSRLRNRWSNPAVSSIPTSTPSTLGCLTGLCS